MAELRKLADFMLLAAFGLTFYSDDESARARCGAIMTGQVSATEWQVGWNWGVKLMQFCVEPLDSRLLVRV